jgi:hypothetical protein
MFCRCNKHYESTTMKLVWQKPKSITNAVVGLGNCQGEKGDE